MGKWYYRNGQLNKAIRLLRKAYAKGIENKSLRDKEYALYYLYLSYKKQNKPDSALLYLEHLVDVQDSIDLKEAKVKIEQLKEKFENEKKQLKIEQLEKTKALDKKIKQLLLFSLALIISGFSYVLYNVYNNYKRNKEEQEKMKQDLEFKSKQLTSQALMMMQKNKLLNEILKTVQQLKEKKKFSNTDLNRIAFLVKSGLKTEDDWQLFKQYFEMVNKDFFVKLKSNYPSLSQSELKLSALIKLKFNIKESATLLNISPDSVKTARHVLRKKFGLKRNENLYDFLSQF